MNASSLTSVFKTQRGFTLLEILIAITLLAFISIAVVSITDNATSTKDRTTEVNQNNLQIETAMSRFEWDFSQIYSPLYFSQIMNINSSDPYGNGGTTYDANGNPLPPGDGTPPAQVSPQLAQYYEQLVQRFQQNEHFMAISKDGIPIPRFYAPEKNLLEFFTSSNRRKLENQKQSHFAWVRYTLADQDQTESEEENSQIPKGLKSLVRYYSADDPYSPKRLNPSEAKAAVLLRNVESLEFQYWNFQRRKWETSLRSIQQGESLIRGVRIFITWYDSFGDKRSAVRIFRTLWPMVTPVDQQAAPPGTATGMTNGGATGTNTGGSNGMGSGATSGGVRGF